MAVRGLPGMSAQRRDLFQIPAAEDHDELRLAGSK